MKFIVRVLINAVALWAASSFVPGITHTGGLQTVLLVAVVFGLLNAIIRPILALLSCPLIILSLGLFTFVLNAGMLLLTSSLSRSLGLGFFVDGFIPALLGGIVISVVSIVLSIFVRDDERA